MEKIIELIKAFKFHSKKADDDVVDRLSNKFSVSLVLIFAVASSIYMSLWDPVICWCDKHFEDKWVDYANAYCWVKNTYYVPIEENIPSKDIPESEKKYIVFYQWMPFILVLQAIGFYIPCLFWRANNQKVGIDATTVLDLCQQIHHGKSIESNKTMLMIVRNHIDRFIGSRQKIKPPKTSSLIAKSKAPIGSQRKDISTSTGFRRVDLYLSILYIAAKLLYLLNSVIQFFFINYIFSMTSTRKDFDLREWIPDFSNGELMPKLYFPRVTMCDFEVRRVGNVQRYTVQCVLPINLYNEMIYLILWFWLLLMIVCNFFSLLLWISRLLCRSDRISYVEKHLTVIKKISENRSARKEIRIFALDYLGQDGILLLRLAGHNTSACLVGEVLAVLWDNWKK